MIIVGAGHAGAHVALFLRQAGHRGRIRLVGDEPLPPYQRPPLSKAFLKGAEAEESLWLRPSAQWAERGISLEPGPPVESIDPEARLIVRADGAQLAGDALVLATGAEARPLALPGAHLAGVHVLRTLAHARALRAELAPGRRLAVVGGGYVGLEVAATARALGLQVVVVEREPRLLARVASAPLARWFADLHQHHHIRLELGAGVAALEEGAPGRVAGVRLADGRAIEADIVVVGVGARSCDTLAVAAGLPCADGVPVDERGATGVPGLFAVGDVTRRPVAGRAERIRLESVPSAVEQARAAAAALAGRPPPRAEVPWFWSDQHDARLQIAGLVEPGWEDIVVRRAEGRISLFHMEGDRVRAVEAVSAPADFMAGRQAIGRGLRLDRAALGDAARPVKAAILG